MIRAEELKKHTKRPYKKVRVELFATNLHNPSHMEWTNDGRLLVSEHTAGTVKDITNGGDMKNVDPFAYGLHGPASMKPLYDGRILISETWGGTVSEISNGGDISKQKPHATGLSMPYTLASKQIDDGSFSVFVSESFGAFHTQITDITNGGERENFKAHFINMPSTPGAPGLTPLDHWPDNWEKVAAAGCVKNWTTNDPINSDIYVAIGTMGQIIRIPDNGGDYIEEVKSQKNLIAWGLQKMGGMYFNPIDRQIYAVQPECGNVIAIDPEKPQNYKFQPPIVQGLQMPTCPRFSEDGSEMYVCDSGAGSIWKVTNF